MTLFAAIAGNEALGMLCARVLEKAEAQGYPRCAHTLKILKA